MLISRSVVERVRRDGAALLSVDVSEDESIREAQSLVAAQVRSLICVPLLIRDRVARIALRRLQSSGGDAG